MLFEVIFWAAACSSISYGIPTFIPYYRNKLLKIYEEPQTTIQEKIDSFDRTNSYIVAATFQLFAVIWSLVNMFFSNQASTESLDALVAGFYLYDTIDLFVKHYGLEYRFFVYHHIVSILLIMLNRLNDPRNLLCINLMYFGLESSSFILNVTTIITYEMPKYKSLLSGVNIISYGLMRIGLLPVILYLYITNLNEFLVVNTIELPIMFLFYGVFISWFIGMIKKYRRS